MNRGLMLPDCGFFLSTLLDIPQNSSSLRGGPLVTGCAFPGCWRIKLLARFHNLVVATRAVAMKGLLVCQGNQLSSDFQLDLRDFRQELRFGLGSSMTIATDNYFGRSWVLLKLVHS